MSSRPVVLAPPQVNAPESRLPFPHRHERECRELRAMLKPMYALHPKDRANLEEKNTVLIQHAVSLVVAGQAISPEAQQQLSNLVDAQKQLILAAIKSEWKVLRCTAALNASAEVRRIKFEADCVVCLTAERRREVTDEYIEQEDAYIADVEALGLPTSIESEATTILTRDEYFRQALSARTMLWHIKDRKKQFPVGPSSILRKDDSRCSSSPRCPQKLLKVLHLAIEEKARLSRT